MLRTLCETPAASVLNIFHAKLQAYQFSASSSRHLNGKIWRYSSIKVIYYQWNVTEPELNVGRSAVRMRLVLPVGCAVSRQRERRENPELSLSSFMVQCNNIAFKLAYIWRQDQPRCLVVRISDYWSWGHGFDSRFYHGDFSLKGKIPMVTIVWVV
jgi:hypothetical protein